MSEYIELTFTHEGKTIMAPGRATRGDVPRVGDRVELVGAGSDLHAILVVDEVRWVWIVRAHSSASELDHVEVSLVRAHVFQPVVTQPADRTAPAAG